MPGDTTAAVCIKGFFDSYRAPWWQDEKRQLQDTDRIDHIEIADVGTHTRSADDGYTENVRDTVERVADRYDDVSIELRTLSRGGLRAREYVEQHGGDEYVDAVVSRATPHQGTIIAKYLPPLTGFEGLDELHPQSERIKNLNAGGVADSVLYVNAFYASDPLVQPYTNGAIQSTNDNVVNVALGQPGESTLASFVNSATDAIDALTTPETAAASFAGTPEHNGGRDSTYIDHHLRSWEPASRHPLACHTDLLADDQLFAVTERIIERETGDGPD